MKVLHLTTWYPSEDHPQRAIWIRRHLEALSTSGTSNTIYHVESAPGKTKLLLGKWINDHFKYQVIVNHLPWRIYEFISFVLVGWVLLKEKRKKYDIINFHIAYPNLIYLSWLKRVIKVPIVITEHWSAYHLNFGLPAEKELVRIKDIFRHPIHLITVSKSLLDDIRNFSGLQKLKGFVIPNVVDRSIFKYTKSTDTNHHFFMLSNWKEPKNPFVAIDAFEEYLNLNPGSNLRIGGYGSLLTRMKEYVEAKGLSNSVEFIGQLNESQISREMNAAMAFIHISNYETFSVVCAEAICCGCPVIASDVGGISEFITPQNGILIKDKSEILTAMKKIEPLQEHRAAIASNGQELFSLESVGDTYYQCLDQICKDQKKLPN